MRTPAYTHTQALREKRTGLANDERSAATELRHTFTHINFDDVFAANASNKDHPCYKWRYSCVCVWVRVWVCVCVCVCVWRLAAFLWVWVHGIGASVCECECECECVYVCVHMYTRARV